MKTATRSLFRSRLIALLVSLILLVPAPAFAARVQAEKPSGAAMAGDALIARPLLIGATVVGTGLFLATLPFTLLGANVKDTGKALVITPAKAAFVRCLGCTPVQDDRNRLEHRQKIESD